MVSAMYSGFKYLGSRAVEQFLHSCRTCAWRAVVRSHVHTFENLQPMCQCQSKPLTYSDKHAEEGVHGR